MTGTEAARIVLLAAERYDHLGCPVISQALCAVAAEILCGPPPESTYNTLVLRYMPDTPTTKVVQMVRDALGGHGVKGAP